MKTLKLLVIVFISVSLSLGVTAGCGTKEAKKRKAKLNYYTVVSTSNDLCKGIVVVQRKGKDGEVEITYELTKNYEDIDKPSLAQAIELIAESMEPGAIGVPVVSEVVKVISTKVTKNPRSEKVLIGIKEGGDCDKFIKIHPSWNKYYGMVDKNNPSLGGTSLEDPNSLPSDSEQFETEEDPKGDTGEGPKTPPVTKPAAKLGFLDSDTGEEYTDMIPKHAKLHVIYERDGAAKQVEKGIELALLQTFRRNEMWKGKIQGPPAEVCSGPNRCSADAVQMSYGAHDLIFEAKRKSDGKTTARVWFDAIPDHEGGGWKIRR